MNTQKNDRWNPARLASLALLAAPLATGCVKSGGSASPQLIETEPNDAACCADYFGFLAPGDFLSIQGSISDDGWDPYDGFAFTAWEPITVEFRLFSHSGFADLDVCLFDPQLGITIDCWESPFDPEFGTAFILSGGTDFHLVVNSFAGASNYTLELNVLPLHFASASDEGAALASTDAMIGAAHSAQEKPDRSADFAAYAGEQQLTELESRDPALVGLGEMILFDEATGDLSTAFLAATTEGTLVWMGKPDVAADAEGR